MRRIVFYSWQSDLPNACNRGFIQVALENAAVAITADETDEIETIIDRDTQGVPGSPDIASTIFAKITAADVFVADVSIIARSTEGRAMPNPNVAIELGYAFKALGHERIILAFNLAYGAIAELPFDLRTRRVLTYNMPEATTGRAPERGKLQAQLDTAIRTALMHTPVAEDTIPIIPAVAAIENAQPNKTIVVRRNLDEILQKIIVLQPRKFSEGGTADELMDAIAQTQVVVAEFSKIAEMIAIMRDTDSAVEMTHWFGKLFELYNTPENFNGRTSNADYDYFKFLGHEMFVTMIAFLLREQRWEMMIRIFDEPIPVRYASRFHGPGQVEWEYASDHLSLLLDESPRRRRVSLHSDILQARHTDGGGLAAILPFQEFMDADYFLFLLGELPPENGAQMLMTWRPWSYIWLRQAPTFIRNAERTRIAEEIRRVLQLPNIEEFKTRLAERGPHIHELLRAHFGQPFLTAEDIERIGTR